MHLSVLMSQNIIESVLRCVQYNATVIFLRNNMNAQAPSKPTIEPFWQHISKVFAYPAKTDNLMTIGILSVMGFVGGFLPFIGMLLAGVAWVFTCKYAYGVLAHTAEGNLEPPNDYQADASVAWQQGIMWFLMAALAFASFFLDPLVGICVSLFALFCLPIATMILAMDESLGSALNPGKWMDGIGRIGWPYLALALILLMFTITSGAIRTQLSDVLPFWLTLLMFEFVSKYFFVAMFYLMGYAIYQYHEEFGVVLDERAVAQTELARHGGGAAAALHPAIQEAEALIVNGNMDEAKAVLRPAANYEGPFSDVMERYRKVCELTEDKEELTAIDRRRLSVHLANENIGEAAKLVPALAENNPDFRFDEAAQSLPMTKHLAQNGQHRLAYKLAMSFSKKHPKHRDLVAHYFLAANLLADKFQKHADAAKILGALVKKYPDHPLQPDIEAKQALLARMVTRN